MQKFRSSLPTVRSSQSSSPLSTISAATPASDPTAEPLFDSQWHLAMIGRWASGAYATTLGLERIWEQYRGAGIAVGVWDDGVQRVHWDLEDNYDSAKHVVVMGELNDGQSISEENGHGTCVAGLIAAAVNGVGGTGIAYEADVTGVRIFGGADDVNEHEDRYLVSLDTLVSFDVVNHSYGDTPGFEMDDEWVEKFAHASEVGRHGLGTINVKSAGNDNVDSNGEALNASRYTVTVGALSTKGFPSKYSSYGASLLVSAPAAEVTTDLLGEDAGYNGLLDGDYTDDFGGTSAAAPVTAGVVALMLDANPFLGWRDVHTILAYSCAGTGSLYANAQTNENHSWKWNGAENWNGGGLHYSEDYGYGVVNAFTAVRMAEVWSTLYPVAATSQNEAMVGSGLSTYTNAEISDLSSDRYQFFVEDDISLEHVTLALDFTHEWLTDLRISLVSPAGTTMSLYDGSAGDYWLAMRGISYTFGLEGFRGESSKGLWTLLVSDVVEESGGMINSVEVTGYGSLHTVDDVYHYTDEFLSVVGQSDQAERRLLADTNGGEDWINAAAMHRNVAINLNSGRQSGGVGVSFVRIAEGTVIEHAIAGDGNDILVGNDVANNLYGMRGNDSLTGGAGADSFVFCTPLGADNIDTITDFRSGVDRIVLDADIFTHLRGSLGQLSAAHFVTSDMAWIPEDMDKYLYFDRSNGALFYDEDGNGYGEMTQFAVLTGTRAAATLSHLDVYVVA